MLYVTKKVSFSASHRLFNPTWDDKKNEEVFKYDFEEFKSIHNN